MQGLLCAGHMPLYYDFSQLLPPFKPQETHTRPREDYGLMCLHLKILGNTI